MPNLDGSGPQGKGPGTGRGAGKQDCSGFQKNGFRGPGGQGGMRGGKNNTMPKNRGSGRGR